MKRLIAAILVVISVGVVHPAAQNPSFDPKVSPAAVALFTNPSSLVSTKDAKEGTDTDGWPEILAKLVWVFTKHQLPERDRTRTIARINSERPNKFLFLGDFGPQKRLVSWLILNLDDQNKSTVSNAALSERIDLLEQRIKELEKRIK